MKDAGKHGPNLAAVVVGLLVVGIAAALCLFVFVCLTATVSGTASLPNGTKATINGPFSCSENPSATEIQAGGHLFVFSPTTISIDGVALGPLSATMTDVQIDAGFWSATLRVNGIEVPMRK